MSDTVQEGNVLRSLAPAESPAVYRVKPLTIDPAEYKTVPTKYGPQMRNALAEDAPTILAGNWLIYDESREEVTVAYLIPPGDGLAGLVPLLHTIRFSAEDRPDGTPSVSKTVGWQDENRSRMRDVCTFSKIHRETPEAGAAVLGYGVAAAEWYQRLDPEKYEKHQSLTRNILPRYHLGETPFTSAIVNKDNVLPYHYDRGNVVGSWSMMIGYKHGVDGGYLMIPELGLGLMIEDGSLTCFDGQIALHGVTPFRRLARDAYRYTIVYYAKAGMWRCLPSDEAEVRKGQIARTRKEQARWQRDRERREARQQDVAGAEG